MINDLSIAARFRQIREELKMTQAKFAEALNNTQANVSNYELGLRSVSSEILATMMSQFNVNPAWMLFGGENKKYVNKKDSEKADGYIDATVEMGIIDIHTEQLVDAVGRPTDPIQDTQEPPESVLLFELPGPSSAV